MSAIIRKSLNTPEESRPFEAGMGRVDVVNVDAGPVMRGTYLPGWQWTKHIKPIAQTDSCQATHVGYIIEGHLHVVRDDGEEAELEQGDYFVIPPGHDAWVVGDEPVILIDWSGAQGYALPPAE